MNVIDFVDVSLFANFNFKYYYYLLCLVNLYERDADAYLAIVKRIAFVIKVVYK